MFGATYVCTPPRRESAPAAVRDFHCETFQKKIPLRPLVARSPDRRVATGDSPRISGPAPPVFSSHTTLAISFQPNSIFLSRHSIHQLQTSEQSEEGKAAAARGARGGWVARRRCSLARWRLAGLGLEAADRGDTAGAQRSARRSTTGDFSTG